MSTSNVPTYEQAREAAGLPEVVDLESIIDMPITVLQFDPATRRLLDTGKETEGFEMLFEDHKDGKTRMTFVGAVVLVKELKALAPPFSTTVRKENRTYKFSQTFKETGTVDSLNGNHRSPSMPREITNIELDSISTRDDNPNQHREFNYIFKYSALDTETGAMIAENEFRTVASDIPLNLDEAKNRIADLIETAQT